jgi:hypothetical protein
MEKPYKVTNRDGVYVHVLLAGALTVWLGYRVNGQRDTTVSFGTYGCADWSLARAREIASTPSAHR